MMVYYNNYMSRSSYGVGVPWDLVIVKSIMFVKNIFYLAYKILAAAITNLGHFIFYAAAAIRACASYRWNTAQVHMFNCIASSQVQTNRRHP